MSSCIVADCDVLARWLRIIVFYSTSFLLALFIPIVIWCAMTKACFVFYRFWRCVNERNDSLKPNFKNARKLAQITWSEYFYAQRQIERAHLELNKELTFIEKLRRRIQEDIKGLPSLKDKKHVFFVEKHKTPSSSSSTSTTSSSPSRITTASSNRASSIGLSTTC